MRGKLKHIATIQKRKDVPRNRFHDLTDFENVCDVWCQRSDGKSNKLIEGGQMVVVNEVTFVMDEIELDAGAHRIIESGFIHEITGVLPSRKNMIIVNTVRKGKWQKKEKYY